MWESITKLYANRFWRFPFEGVVGLITERCAKCFCGLGFEHFYSGLKAPIRSDEIARLLRVTAWL
jgi:hypothetical protein